MKPGKIEIIPAKGKAPMRVVVAAPHGEHDKFTGEIVRGICAKMGVCGVVASDFVNPETKLRVNVNRPTEGAGVDPREETLTPLSARLYHRYLKSILQACSGNLDFYVEVHGNEHKELANRIEVATWNLNQQTGKVLKRVYKEVNLVNGFPKLKSLKLKLWVEGINPIEKRAWANKLFGVLPLSKFGLHFELPISTRSDEETRSETISVLSQLIAMWYTRTVGMSAIEVK